MECQNLFSGQNEKNISRCCLLRFYPQSVKERYNIVTDYDEKIGLFVLLLVKIHIFYYNENNVYPKLIKMFFFFFFFFFFFNSSKFSVSEQN